MTTQLLHTIDTVSSKSTWIVMPVTLNLTSTKVKEGVEEKSKLGFRFLSHNW